MLMEMIKLVSSPITVCAFGEASFPEGLFVIVLLLGISTVIVSAYWNEIEKEDESDSL